MSLPNNPFEEIAICLSGGGYRAASFHLGSLAYLHRINFKNEPLIEKIKAISTVSGGTITGATYALRNSQGMSFEEYYNELLNFLQNHDLIKESLKKLKADGNWNCKSKSRNLINAFSEIYDVSLTGQATYKELTINRKGHIDFCAFNATEFSTGINFRFQSEWRGKVQNKMIKRGNSNYTFNFDAQNEIKIADIIAASSCFPGGFEPINFPNDFIHQNTPSLEALMEKEAYKEGIGVMDGGIYDNQGIDSIQLSERRRATIFTKKNPSQPCDRLAYDLLIISDVSSPDIQAPFRFHKLKENSIGDYNIKQIKGILSRSNNNLNWISTLLIVVGLILGFINSWGDKIGSGIGVMLIFIGLILWFCIHLLQKKLKKWTGEIRSTAKTVVGDFYLSKLKDLQFDEYKIKDLEPLFFDRLNSVLLMVNEIFLKQVRRLKYASIYEDSHYENRRISNLIKELTPKDWYKTSSYRELKEVDKILKGNYNQVVGKNIRNLSLEAASFGTTLWFTEEDKLADTLNKLVAIGHITMCFNLMVYITKLKNHRDFKNYSVSTKGQVNKILNQCKDDWIKFKNDPLFIVGN